MELVVFLFILFCGDPNNPCSFPLLCSVNGSERKRMEEWDQTENGTGYKRGPSSPGELEYGHSMPVMYLSLCIGKGLSEGREILMGLSKIHSATSDVSRYIRKECRGTYLRTTELNGKEKCLDILGWESSSSTTALQRLQGVEILP